MATYRLENLDCAVCASKIEDSLRKCDFVRSVSIDFGTLSMKIDASSIDAVAAAIGRVDPAVRISGHSPAGKAARTDEGRAEPTKAPARQVRFGSYSLPLTRVVIFVAAAALWAAGIAVELLALPGLSRYAPLVPFILAYALAGAPVLRDAVRNVARGHALDENFLMSIATIGAFAVGEWEEAVGVMIFYMIGELVQEAAVLRSRRSIDALLALKPDRARIRVGDAWIELAADEVAVGSMVLVRPGERIPLDGVVTEGSGYIDSSMLTGESAPVRVGPGVEVRSGTTATDGVLTIRTTHLAGESSAARIIELVENASHAKAKTERFITVFARYYTPAVVGVAILVACIPPLFVPGALLSDWLYRALIMLVISCPCALVVSVPLGYFGGIGGMSRRGILVKGAVHLDSLAAARRVVFDKTGTLTEGRFSLIAVRPAPGVQSDDLLRLAAAAEANSNHPVAAAITAAATTTAVKDGSNGNRALPLGTAFREIAGRGIESTVDGRIVLVGNERLLADAGIEVSADSEASPNAAEVVEAYTVSHVAADGVYLGKVLVGDAIKASSAATIKRLSALGVKETVMLTGDAPAAAAAVARELGLTSYYAGLLPEDKLEKLESLSRGAGRTLFVGDGINDAPVLARADVGIAMGSGADAAVEAADVVIMTDDPLRVSEAIDRARRTRSIVMQNVVFALAFKGVFLALGAAGLANMWEAVIADVGVALVAVLNSTRALK
jgi:Cd2+/Zn2+-exporting ATPase